MFCKKCGNQIAEESAFCPYCGSNHSSMSDSGFTVPGGLENQTATRKSTSGTLARQTGGSNDTPPVYHGAASFCAAGSLEQNTVGNGASTVRQGNDTKSPLKQVGTYCPKCGTANEAGGVFCTVCGHRLRTESIQPGKKRKRILTIGISAAVVCVVLFLGAFLAGNLGSSDMAAAQEEPDTYSAAKEIEVYTTEDVSQRLEEGQIQIRGDVLAVLAYAEKIVRTASVTRVYMYDMDGDNVRELILKTATCEADAQYDFYSYHNASLHYLGGVSAGHSNLYIQDEKLMQHIGTMGHEIINELTLQEGSVVSTCIFEREIGESQEYFSFSKEPFYSEGSSLSVLTNTFVDSEEQIADTKDYFEQTGDYFTNGRIYYKVLPDGQILCVDAVTGEVSTLFGYVKDFTALFAVTEDRLYFIYDDPEDWWGIEVYSYTIEGDDYQHLGGGWEAEFRDGIILLKSFRSDVSPRYVTAIDSHDRTLISKVDVWDAAIFNGAVYYLDLATDTWSKRLPYEAREYRIDPSGKSLVATFEMTGGFAWIDNGAINISQGSTTTSYDLLTGKEK